MSPDLRKVIEISIDAINKAVKRIGDDLTVNSSSEKEKEETDEEEQSKEGEEESKEEPKLEPTKNDECVTVKDFQQVIQQKFESRIRRLISSLPKGRVLLVKAIEECFTGKKEKMVDEVGKRIS